MGEKEKQRVGVGERRKDENGEENGEAVVPRPGRRSVGVGFSAGLYTRPTLQTLSDTMAAPKPTSQRLLRELKDYARAPNEALLHLGPVDEDDLLQWEAVLKGVPGTPYEGEQHQTLRGAPAALKHRLTSAGGLWRLQINLPSNYPLSPPSIHFTTRISHPNISFTTGEICLTLLTSEHWSPVYTLSTTMSAIHHLLTDPQPDSPLNVDVAALLRDGDIPGWESMVRFWTEEERWAGPGNLGR
jgi:peroxin-4